MGNNTFDRNLALEFVRVTEAAAIAASSWIGKGDKNRADQAAVNEMRARFNQMDFGGEIVIGEGKKDKAPLLFIGERVGKTKTPFVDIAVDPLECTDSVAYGRYNAISVITAGPKGSLLCAPDTYMEKIAVGPRAREAIDMTKDTKTNIQNVAKALDKDISEMTIVVLDRPRHEKLIEDIRSVGARVRLITDGDVAAAIAPSLAESGVDMLIGIGASAEGVLAATAIRILGGQLLCRFKPKDEDMLQEIKDAGITDLEKIYQASDLAQGEELTFTATGVIDGPLLKGVQVKGNATITHSLVMRKSSGTSRYITTYHHLSQN